MAIYRAYCGDKEITDFYIGGKQTKQIWGGNTLLWEKTNSAGDFVFTWTGQFAVWIVGDCVINTGIGSDIEVNGERQIQQKSDAGIHTAVIKGDLKNFSFWFSTEYNVFVYCNVISVLTPFPKSMSAIKKFLNPLFNNQKNLQSFPDNLLSNLSELENVNNMFASSNIEAIPEMIFSKNVKIKFFQNCFANCEKLTSIPSGLFRNNVNAQYFKECFTGCIKIQSIPSGLFTNNVNALNFDGCFSQCEILSHIPNGLFKGLSKAASFSKCFRWFFINQYTGVPIKPVVKRTIPPDLFQGCTSAQDFSECFMCNFGAEVIPENLFASCPNANDFSYCFGLYSRNDFDDADAKALGHLLSAPKLWEQYPNMVGGQTMGCYRGQGKLPYYDTIPPIWKY